MKRNSLIIIGSVVGVILLFVLWYVNVRNGMVTRDQAVNEAWANVQSSYQRRMDFYNTVVNTIKGSADFEKTTLTQVIEARNRASSIKLDASDLSSDKIQQYQQAQEQYKTAFNVVVEQYPQIKTTEAFLTFQAQQEGTENRINKARDDFNETVKEYNSYLQRFPNSMFIGGSYKVRDFFKADEAAQHAPTVDFSGTGSDKDKK